MFYFSEPVWDINPFCFNTCQVRFHTDICKQKNVATDCSFYWKYGGWGRQQKVNGAPLWKILFNFSGFHLIWHCHYPRQMEQDIFHAKDCLFKISSRLILLLAVKSVSSFNCFQRLILSFCIWFSLNVFYMLSSVWRSLLERQLYPLFGHLGAKVQGPELWPCSLQGDHCWYTSGSREEGVALQTRGTNSYWCTASLP